jgi:hypothetical protein
MSLWMINSCQTSNVRHGNNNNKLLPFGRQSYGREILLCMFMLPYQIHSLESIGSLQLSLYTTAQEVVLNLQLSFPILYEGNIGGNLLYYREL